MSNLSSFNSFYELAAGISSALAGFKVVQNFLIDRLERSSHSFKKELEDTNVLVRNFIEQVTQYVAHNNGVLHQTDGKASELLRNSLAAEDWCNKRALELSSEHERTILSNMATMLFLYSFLFYACLIILTGCCTEGIITNRACMAYTANLEFTTFFAMITLPIISNYVRRWKALPVRVCITSFPLLCILSWLLTFLPFWKPAFNWIVGGSILVSIFPLFVMLAGRWIAWIMRKPKVKKGLCEKKRMMEEGKHFLNQELEKVVKVNIPSESPVVQNKTRTPRKKQQ